MAATDAAASTRNFTFKVVLLGEGCVGKTSLVLRYVENKFNDKHITTLQVKLLRPFVSVIISLRFWAVLTSGLVEGD